MRVSLVEAWTFASSLKCFLMCLPARVSLQCLRPTVMEVISLNDSGQHGSLLIKIMQWHPPLFPRVGIFQLFLGVQIYARVHSCSSIRVDFFLFFLYICSPMSPCWGRLIWKLTCGSLYCPSIPTTCYTHLNEYFTCIRNFLIRF